MKRLPGIQPSRGCTEPAAIALAAALAARAATGSVRAVSVLCDRSTLKNAQAARIPGTQGLTGAKLAAALGAIAGDPARRLEALSGTSQRDVERAQRLISGGTVQVGLHPQAGRTRIWIEARVETDAANALARLEDAHTRVVALEADGARVNPPAWASSCGPPLDPSWEGYSLRQVLAEAECLSGEDAEALLAALHANLTACAWKGPSERGADLPTRAELLAERGSLARMEGYPVTVVTSGFSGNQGLVASIPVWIVAEELGVAERELARALAVSHLVGSYVRSFTGVLSPLCNAVQAASAGAAAGCAKLLGGGEGEIERAAKRVLAASGGIVCDGAKPACSLKVGLGAAQAVRAASGVMEGTSIELRDGVAAETLEGTAKNLARIAYPGMQLADEELLEVVLSKTDLS
ncbi:MAG: L-serine ammonia-lyase, iron-sulfur-dependent, subunit alpha [Planctomycetes bacterium]|nr:L-serine ammonia-lyase, iron-sulfur-dependent, subunit alpha [Planctomycetota bacterium]